MCGPQALAFLIPGAGAAGAATAAGATAAAATGGLAGLTGIGTALSVGGALFQGISGMAAARQQSAAIAEQAATEARLTATKDQRERREFLTAISQQRAELAARGISLDSPTAIALGQTAAAEMSFGSQALRSEGAARQSELSASGRMVRAQGVTSLLRGGFSAAGSVLNAAPDLWPGFDRPRSRVLA